MKIISKRKDYYDYLGQVYGVDSKITYNRKSAEREYKKRGTKRAIMEYIPKKTNALLVSVIFEYIQVWFCDKNYPLIRVAFVPKGELTKEVSALFTSYEELEKVWRPFVKWSEWDHKDFKDHFYTNLTTKLNTEEGSPQIVQRGGLLLIDAILKDWDFHKIVPPEQAFQRVSMFLGAKPDPPQQIPTEMNRFEAKGFDKKTSFRNM